MRLIPDYHLSDSLLQVHPKKSTPVKSKGINRQHLTSTPKLQTKLFQAAHKLTAELSTKWQGSPHGVHIHQNCEGSAQTGWGEELWGWQTFGKICNASLDSSLISIDDHTQLTTKFLMERHYPTQNRSTFSGEEDILSVHDSSNIEMVSTVDPLEHHSEDSTPDSGSEGEGRHSASGPGSKGHLDSNRESDSGNEDSQSESDSEFSSDSKDSDDGDDFSDMFSTKKTYEPVKKKQESWAQSNSHSRSRKLEPHK